ncbi:MAG: hypothetical protein L6R38_007062 [Xanthoria sp. 2 TBL-2021]|nr:MAG: hypothetical protein L6R38_007062 [Xanthoria sp. 2 TBL-2021]
MAHEKASQKDIVILGGSYGGVSTAHYLLKHVTPRLPHRTSYQVILVSSSFQAMCRPACPRALISDDVFPQEKLFVDIPQAFEQYPKDSFRFIHGTATQLNHTNRTVSIATAVGNIETIHIEYHALVIATGSSTPSPLHGLNRDADSLKTSWIEFRKALPTASHIIIAGGGPAGIETAGELGEYLNGRKGGWFGLSSPKVSITVVTAGSKILPALRPTIAAKAEEYLAAVGVTVIKNARVKSVMPMGAGTDSALTSETTVTLDNGKTLEADLYIPATGTTPNTKFIHESLLAADGRINTNPTTLRVDEAGPRVYAIGDVANYSPPAIHHILEAVPVLCTNLKRDLLHAFDGNGIGELRNTTAGDRIFKPDMRESQLVPIGKSKGVGAAMGWALPSYAVWAIKGRDYWLWMLGPVWSGRHWVKER